MPSSFICPTCGRRLGGVPATGRLDMACVACGQRFHLAKGRLVRVVAAPARTSNRIRAAEQKATGWAIVGGAAMTMTIAFVFGALDGGVEAALASASLGGIACGLLLKRRMTPTVPVRYFSPDSRAAFATARRLRMAKGGLMSSRNSHAAALKNKESLRRRLVGLRSKMADLALAAYGPRIASIDSGVGMLDRQIEMDRLLCEKYDRSIKMIEVELESGAAADEMNEDVSAALTADMSELKALEESQAELERQLEANVEVEQLLRSTLTRSRTSSAGLV